MRSVFQWSLGGRSLELGRRTLIMGVLNVTPDSFSDGGLYFDCEKALAHASRLLEQGADIVDIGGESTRPGARVSPVNEPYAPGASAQSVVTADEEIQRVVPVISKLKARIPEAIVSVDTYKSAVALAAVDAGAEIVNDVSGFRWDPEMIATLANSKCGAVLMHMRGRPHEWRSLPPPEDVVRLVADELQELSGTAVNGGVSHDRIVLDAGFGFGKSFDENYPLLAHFAEFSKLGFPLLVGVSRKSFIGRMLACEGKDAAVEARLYGTLAAEVALILSGAHIIRTHDVRPAVEAARAADIILQTQ
jgi:dihydropteroate synthase